jgi:Tfp pilus assembly protein PilF
VLSYSFDHDWTSAELDFKRALELNPSVAHGHLEYATALVTRARFDAAIAHIRAARALDPLSFAIGNDLSFALECAGRYEESIASAADAAQRPHVRVRPHSTGGRSKRFSPMNPSVRDSASPKMVYET